MLISSRIKTGYFSKVFVLIANLEIKENYIFQSIMSTSNVSSTLVEEIRFAVNFFLNEDILSKNMKIVMIMFYSVLVTIAGQ